MSRDRSRGVLDDEWCVYGGFLATRREVYEHLASIAPPGTPALSLERLMYGPRAATPAEIDALRSTGRTFAAYLAARPCTPPGI